MIAHLTALALALGLVAPAFAKPVAYVLDGHFDNVAIIDLTTNTVATTIDLPPHPSSMAVDPSGRLLYVTSSASTFDGVLSTVHTPTGSTTQIALNGTPSGVFLHPNGQFAYVSIVDPFATSQELLTVIDTLASEVATSIPIAYGAPLLPPAQLPDSGPIYLAGNTVIWGFDFDTNAFVQRIAAPWRLGRPVTSESTLFVLSAGPPVALGAPGELLAIDTSSGTIVNRTKLDLSPRALALSPDQDLLYFAHGRPGNISVVDATTLTELRKIPASVSDLALSEDGSRLYTVDSSGRFTVFDTSSDAVVDEIVLGGVPFKMALAEATDIACIGDCGADGNVTVDEIVTATNIALGTTPMESCMLADADYNDAVTADELIAIINDAMHGCARN